MNGLAIKCVCAICNILHSYSVVDMLTLNVGHCLLLGHSWSGAV